MRSRVLIVIPARYASTRFPGKPLALIAGVSLVERVYRLCKRVAGKPRVIVATDDHRIKRHVRDFGGEVMMTRRNHPSGTDRVAEVARKFSSDIVINVQGDEPILDPRVIEKLAKTMIENRSLMMGTLCHPLESEREYRDPNVVKVVLNQNNDAIYFSRSPIPHLRNSELPTMPKRSVATASKVRNSKFLRHVGIYAYRKSFLLQYVRWPQSPLEQAEKLEQLRALSHGIAIRVLSTNYHAIGVDVPADVHKVERVLQKA